MNTTIRKSVASIVVTPVLTGTGAYTSGNCVGTLMELPNAVDNMGGVAQLTSAVMSDADNQKAAITLIIFGSKPAGTFTDQASPTVSNADRNLVVASYALTAAGYISLGSSSAIGGWNSILAKCKAATATNQLGSAGKPKSLWAVLITTGTPTYTTTSSLQLTLNFEKDS